MKYDIIYADPPWTFKTYSQKGKGRSAEAHYDCMSLDEIKALPVSSWASKSATLYLWSTVPHLESALAVISAWGFEYKSQFVWIKDRMGTGYWVRNRHELLLIAARGSGMAPRFRGLDLTDSVIMERAREHSRKPDTARRIIEYYHPGVRKLEMFARIRAEGWDAWGLEVDSGPGDRRWPSSGGAPE